MGSPFWGPKPSAKASSRSAQLLPALGGAVGLDFQQGDRQLVPQARVFKAVVVAELQGVVDHPLQAGGVVQGPAGGVVGHAHAGQLAQQTAGVVLHEGGEVPWSAGGGHPPVVGTGGVFHRQGHGLLHQGEEVGPHLGPQHGDVGPGDRGRGLEGGEEGRPVELVPGRPHVGLRQGQELVPGVLDGTSLLAVEDVQQVEKVQVAEFLEDVVGAADGVAAVDQHQFLHLPGQGRLDHRLAEAAQVGVGHLVGQVEVLRGLVSRAHWPPRAVRSSVGVYLQT